MKKLLICSAIAAALGLSGCGGSGQDITEIQAQTPIDKPFARIIFDPPAVFPLPSDVAMIPATSLFDFTIESEAQGAAYNPGNPLDAVGSVDGWSTQMPMTIDFELPNGLGVEPSSLLATGAIRIFEAEQALEGDSQNCQEVAQALTAPGIPCDVGDELQLGVDFAVGLSDADTLAIVPLKPLKPNQGYMLVITEALKDTDGRGIKGSVTWNLVRQDVDSLPLATPDQLLLQRAANLLVQAAESVGIDREVNSYTAYISTGTYGPESGTVSSTAKNLLIGQFAAAVQNQMPIAEAAQFLPAILVNEHPTLDTAFDNVADRVLGGLPEDQVAFLQQVGATNCEGMINILMGEDSPVKQAIAGVFPSVAGLCLSQVKQGQINLPYYLDPMDPLTGRWESACTAGSAVASIESANPGTVAALIAAGQVGPNNGLCQAASGGALYDLDLSSLGIDDRRNLSKVAPIPVAQGRGDGGTEALDVQITVPDPRVLALIGSDITRPETGWPVVVLQHGITSKKEDLLTVTAALSAEGFATVAIDHPLHGSRGMMSTGANARPVNASEGLPGGGATDYLNFPSLLTARDNLRQSIADVVGLRLGLNVMVDLTANPNLVINPQNVHFLGQSLGSITGIGSVAVANASLGNDQIDALFKFQTAGLSVPGTGIATFLTVSQNFGALVTGGVVLGTADPVNNPEGAGAAVAGAATQLALEAGITPEQLAENPGILGGFAEAAWNQVLPNLTVAQQAEVAATMNSFAFAAQTVIDAGDPSNYYFGLNDTPVLVHQVNGDTVIPNRTPLATSGTEELIRFMDLEEIKSTKGVEQGYLRGVVRFINSSHGSLVNPTVNAAATKEMRDQMISFFKSGGTSVVVNDETVLGDPVPRS